MTHPNSLRTFLWFEAGQLDQALPFYQGIFTDFKLVSANPMGDGTTFTAEFEIHEHQLVGMAVAGGPKFNDSISLSLSVDGQAEVDRLWDALTADGGEPGRCGWLKDRFGVSWQVTPYQMGAYLGNPDPAIRAYAQQALMRMNKIVIADFTE